MAECWEEISIEVLARLYSYNHEIVNAMIVNNGKTNFFIRKGWIVFEIQETIFS